MSKYRVFLEAMAGATVTVEADNEEDAIEAAHDLAPDICAQCSGWGKDYSLDIGEWALVDDALDSVELMDDDA